MVPADKRLKIIMSKYRAIQTDLHGPAKLHEHLWTKQPNNWDSSQIRLR